MNTLSNLLVYTLLGLSVAEQDELNVRRVIKELGVIPDVIKEPPQELLKMHFENGIEIVEGETYTPSQLKIEPRLEWSAMEDSYYTIIMLSPDAPNREYPIYRSWLHWLVVNVPGMDLANGQPIAEYFGPIPPKESGLLRYVALVYHQTDKLEFEEQIIDLNNAEDHANFDVDKFTQKYELSKPFAANVFQAQWDESVPESMKMLYDISEK